MTENSSNPMTYASSTTQDNSVNETLATTLQTQNVTWPSYQGDLYTEHVIESLVIVIGLVGTIANSFVLYILVVSQQIKKRTVNVLFMNQMSLDLFSCVWLVITYALNLTEISMQGLGGYLLCVLVMNETFIYFGLVGGLANLAIIAIERCLKIVHPFWHKKHVRKWMINVLMAAVWICTIIYNFSVGIPTTLFIDGVCYSYANIVTPADRYGIAAEFAQNFIFMVLTFCICYGRILLAVRRQARVFAKQHANNSQMKTANETNLRIQMNAIKTMLLISVSFVVCWGPFYAYNMVYVLFPTTTFQVEVYYFVMLLSFFNLCLNPFIYATKYDIVKQKILELAQRLKPGSPTASMMTGETVNTRR